jgi:hypothetical protein
MVFELGLVLLVAVEYPFIVPMSSPRSFDVSGQPTQVIKRWRSERPEVGLGKTLFCLPAIRAAGFSHEGSLQRSECCSSPDGGYLRILL